MLSNDSEVRKNTPMARGLIDYFPDALAAVAEVSMKGAKKHGTFNEDGDPTWDKSKSTDHADCIVRHLADRGQYQPDGSRHSAALAWRALALLQIEIDNEKVAASGINQFAEFEAMAAAVGEAVAQADRPEPWGSEPLDKAAGSAGVFVGVDLAKPGSDDTAIFIRGNGGVYTIYGDPYLTRNDVANLLGVPLDQVVDGRPKKEAPEPVLRENLAIPTGVYWCTSCYDFHNLEVRSLGGEFRKRWYDRRREFPTDLNTARRSTIPGSRGRDH